MDYKDANYGVSKQGVENLLEAIRGELITKVAEQCTDIKEIETSVEKIGMVLHVIDFLKI